MSSETPRIPLPQAGSAARLSEREERRSFPSRFIGGRAARLAEAERAAKPLEASIPQATLNLRGVGGRMIRLEAGGSARIVSAPAIAEYPVAAGKRLAVPGLTSRPDPTARPSLQHTKISDIANTAETVKKSWAEVTPVPARSTLPTRPEISAASSERSDAFQAVFKKLRAMFRGVRKS